jgi:Domain of unknown function (DUF3472)
VVDRFEIEMNEGELQVIEGGLQSGTIDEGLAAAGDFDLSPLNLTQVGRIEFREQGLALCDRLIDRPSAPIEFDHGTRSVETRGAAAVLREGTRDTVLSALWSEGGRGFLRGVDDVASNGDGRHHVVAQGPRCRTAIEANEEGLRARMTMLAIEHHELDPRQGQPCGLDDDALEGEVEIAPLRLATEGFGAGVGRVRLDLDESPAGFAALENVDAGQKIVVHELEFEERGRLGGLGARRCIARRCIARYYVARYYVARCQALRGERLRRPHQLALRKLATRAKAHRDTLNSRALVGRVRLRGLGSSPCQPGEARADVRVQGISFRNHGSDLEAQGEGEADHREVTPKERDRPQIRSIRPLPGSLEAKLWRWIFRLSPVATFATSLFRKRKHYPMRFAFVTSVLILLFHLGLFGVAEAQGPTVATKIDGRSYLGELIEGDEVRLLPDQCFFDGPGLRLREQREVKTAADPLNGKKSYALIEGLKADNSLSWFLHFPRAGEVEVTLELGPGAKTEGRTVVAIDDRRFPLRAQAVKVRIDKAGLHRLRLLSETKSGLKVAAVTLRGGALGGGAVIRARWRPAAAHASFSASSLPQGGEVWIMELDAHPGEASIYAPMTTPFGYFGPSWTKEGRPTGLNFSMWSYGRNKPEPPVKELSHLIAVGNPKLRFDGFGHEGTGVKPRGWHPFGNWKGQSCVLALRRELGPIYDTYSGYVFHEATQSWELFAAGRKHHPKKPDGRRTGKGLRPGTFVEVPGPPHRQRTGHLIRKLRYRGFLIDDKGKPHGLDRMTGRRGKKSAGNRGRGVSEDGRFELWTGGMEQFATSPAQSLKVSPDASKYPWMNPKKLAAIFRWPTTVEVLEFRIGQAKLTLRYRGQGLGKVTRARLYFGPEDALTLASRWAHSIDLDGQSLKSGEHELGIIGTLPLVPESTRFARLLVENEKGKFWSLTTVECTKP